MKLVSKEMAELNGEKRMILRWGKVLAVGLGQGEQQLRISCQFV